MSDFEQRDDSSEKLTGIAREIRRLRKSLFPDFVGQNGGTLFVPVLPAGTTPGEWVQLASGSYATPTPVSLQVMTRYVIQGGVDLQAEDFDCRPFASPVGGVSLFSDAPLQAAIRVIYGAHGVLQRRVIDAMSGTYLLPPCKSVKIEARAYNQQAGAPTIAPYSIQASVTPTTIECGEGEATYSGVQAMAAGAVNAEMFAVQGCRAFRAGINLGIATDVQLEINSGQPLIQIDYSVPFFANQVPDVVPCGVTPPQTFLVRKTGTATCNLFAQQVVKF